MNLRERLEILGIAAGKVFELIEALGYTSKEIKQNRSGVSPVYSLLLSLSCCSIFIRELSISSLY